MSNGTRTRLLVLTLFVAALSTAALAGVTVTPQYVSGESNVNYTVTIDNEAGKADTIELFLDDEAEIIFGLNDAGQVYAPEGWDITVKASEGDAKDTIVLSGNNISQGETLAVNLYLDPVERDLNRLWWSNLSNGDAYSYQVGVDRQPPNLTAKTPTQENLTDPRPAIEASYSDDDVAVATEAVELRLNGEAVNASVDQGSLTYTPTQDLPEGKNNVSLRLVDELGNAQWYNWSFGLAVKPLIQGAEPRGLISDDRPTVRVIAKDPSGIDFAETWIDLDGQQFTRQDNALAVTEMEAGTEYALSLTPPSFLDDGVHHVTVKAVDTKGKVQKRSWNFTTDVTKPSISFVSVSGDQEIYKETMGIFIEAEDATAGIAETVFRVAGQTDTVSTRTGDQFRGAIDTTNLLDGERTLNITVKDRAGNVEWATRQFIVDNTPPSINSVSVFPDPTNTAPDISVRASDDATSVVAAEYFIGDDPGVGDASSIPVEGETGDGKRFASTVDVSQLEDGDHRLHVRVKDTAQHWTDLRTAEFTLDRSLEASIAFEELAPVRVQQGGSGQVTVPVTNTGRVPAAVNLSTGDAFEASVSPSERTIKPGETRSFTLTVSAADDRDIGNATLDLTAMSGTSRATTATTVVVTANQETKERFEQRIQEIEDRMEALNDRRERWRRQISEQSLDNVTEVMTEAEADLQDARDAIKAGNYRRAARQLPVIDTNLNTAGSTLDTSIERFKQTRRTRNIVLAAVALLIIVGVTVAYRMMPPPEGYSEGGGFIHRPEGKHPARARGEAIAAQLKQQLDRLIQRLAERIETYRDVEDDEDEGWSGYDPSV